MKQLFYSALFAVVLALLPSALFGQRTISGQVTDAETKEPLLGANVLVQGTTSGTITDFDGNFSLEVPEGTTALVVSYTGYAEVVVPLGAENTINVELTAGELLDEVVVIGYGTVKKEDATGAIQTIDQADFNKGAINTPQELLAGKVAGVQITQGSAPGDGAAIRIRGGSSLSASNDPLIVVDGIPLDNGGISGSRNVLNAINPNDIETFTVLKDASATAIYGSRASNGVIIITTKNGKLGQGIKVNYSGNVSIAQNVQNLDVLSADEFRSLVTERFGEGHPADTLLGSANTNWQDEIYQTAFGQDHNLSLSGGIGEYLPYRVSLGFTNREGVLKTDEFQRTTVGVNLTPKFLDNRLQFKISFKGSLSQNQFANRGAIGSAARFDPTRPVYDENSPYGGFFTWTDATTGNPNSLAPANPVALLELRDDNSDVTRYITNASVDYRFGFLPELRANLNVGYDYAKGEGMTEVPNFASFSFDAINGGGNITNYTQTKENQLLDFYLNYVKEFGNQKFDVMAGYSWQHFFYDNYSISMDQAGTPINTQEFEDTGELYLVSLFGRLNYTIDNKYIFTFTLRRDGSSRFSPDTRWGLFPAAAFAWKIIDNQPGVLNNLKLRLGYGVTGQQEIGSYYQYLPTYTFGLNNAAYPFGNDYIITLRPEEYDANIKWEETTTYNVGLDFSLLNDRLSGSIEYYQRTTADLLNRIPVPAGTNLSNFIDTNVGDLENRGVEISLNAIAIQSEDITWDIGVNFTRNQNEITKLTATDDPDYIGVQVGGIAGGLGNTVQIHSVGYAASTYYLYEQVYNENGAPVEGLYVDRNGDGRISPLDLYRLENPAPDMFLGINSTFSYKNLDLSFSARANIGNSVYNNVQSDFAYYSGIYNSTNFLTNVHRDIYDVQFQNPQYLSDHFLQDGSFLRVDYITLNYRFGKLLNGAIDNLSLSATIQNPILITDYSGLDPEIFGGIDNNIYPRSRNFVFGVNASF
ncbi:MAG: TonB-dependent receptor [Saprospiraceae bacterium]|nr:TonB-dependent receptor [Saprospiraceae bacterium]